MNGVIPTHPFHTLTKQLHSVCDELEFMELLKNVIPGFLQGNCQCVDLVPKIVCNLAQKVIITPSLFQILIIWYHHTSQFYYSPQPTCNLKVCR